jgi:hypothetical protein
MARSAHFQNQLKAILAQDTPPILFAGRLKSGNTWLRFLIYNYYNLLYNKADKTLTYHELNAIQHDEIGDPKPIKGPKAGFPYIVRTHMSYTPHFKGIDKGIYIYRNPLDTLVSAYHFHKNHQNPVDFLNDLNAYVLHNLVLWEVHVYEYRKSKQFISVSYEALQADAEKELARIINYLGDTYVPEIGVKSVALSSFNNIRKMGRNVGQAYGNGGKDFKGEFTRKGKVGGYMDELKPETIQQAESFLKKHGLGSVDYFVS